jgi:hypothetical protein
MTRYNNNRATPGNKANMRLFMQKEYLKQNNNSFNTNNVFQNINNSDQITESNICLCASFRANNLKQGYNDPSQTTNMRYSVYASGILGGKTTFGNLNTPQQLNYLGGWEGQPGGAFRPIRNTF